MSNGRGVLTAIWKKPGRHVPMRPVSTTALRAGRGIVGSATPRGRRQVTLLDRQRWSQVERALGREVDPRLRRANLMIDGLSLVGSRGRVLRIGPCRIRILGETTPCRLMDEQLPGLQAALRPDWGGGAFGEVLDDGILQVGDPVHWDEDERPA